MAFHLLLAFWILTVTFVASAYGRATGIEGQDPSKPPVYYAVGAPSCHGGNFHCILPDYDDGTAFYQCVSGCTVAVKQYCASCLHFDFWTQRCEWPGEAHAPPSAPALCSMLPPTTPTTDGPTEITNTESVPTSTEVSDIFVPSWMFSIVSKAWYGSFE